MTAHAGAGAHWAGRSVVALVCALQFAPPAVAQIVTPRYTLTAEQWREDLRVMMDELARRHRSLYHTTSAAAFDSAAKALHARIPTLARHEIILELARIVAQRRGRSYQHLPDAQCRDRLSLASRSALSLSRRAFRACGAPDPRPARRRPRPHHWRDASRGGRSARDAVHRTRQRDGCEVLRAPPPGDS